ncbi:MAG: type II secretion system F family protein [Phycisphaerae bacterium]|nr:type II secretion system F family protein [Phycisphaerae bacterium]
MRKFAYQVRDSAGQPATGVLAANDVAEATRLLRREGKTIISLAAQGPEAAGAAAGIGPLGKKRVRKDDIVFFATQLAVMVDTGVPLTDSLDCIREGTPPGPMRSLLADVSEQVKGGVSFSDALDRHPKAFGKLFAAMVRASEASGTMGPMLERASEYLERDRDIRKKITGAMTYPICMFGFCILVVTALLLFVLPRFEKIYQGKGAVLPLPTRMLLGVSSFLIHYWPLVLLGLVGAIAGIYAWAGTPEGRRAIDKVRLTLPVLGPMTRKACLARSLRTMATMVSTGVSMLEGLNLTAEVAGNSLYREVWTNVAEKVEQGATLSEELRQHPLIPRPITTMVAAGEHTGQLGPVMNRAAAFCENDLKIAIKTVTDMIEPAMIIVMGFIVGGIAISLLLPIFSVSKLMAR